VKKDTTSKEFKDKFGGLFARYRDNDKWA